MRTTTPAPARFRSLWFLLAAAAIPAGVAVVSACAGGGGGGNNIEPCCDAAGSVEAPGSGPALSFAGTAPFSGLRVRPVIYSTNAACPTISNPDLPGLLDLEAAADPADIDPIAGTYEVTLGENAIGQRVAFVVECVDSAVCTGGLTEGVAGVGLLGGEVTPGGPVLQVAPIRLVSSTGGIGVSTLELLADCELDTRGVRGNLTTADVRHVITPAIAASLAPTTAGADALIAHLTLFDAAMASPRGFYGTNGQAQLFEDTRITAEAQVDRCLAGESILGCASATTVSSELLRYFRFARDLTPVPGATPTPPPNPTPGPTPPNTDLSPYVLQTWAQQISDKLGPDPIPATDVLGSSMLRQDELFRYQLARKEIEETLLVPITSPVDGSLRTVNLSYTTSGVISINEAFAILQTDVLTVPTDNPLALGSAWQNASRAIMLSIDKQVYDNGQGVQPMSGVYNAGVGYATQLRTTLGPASTADQAFAAVYGNGDGTTGLYQRLYTDVGTNIVPVNEDEGRRLTDILFFGAANSVAPMGTVGFAPAKPAPTAKKTPAIKSTKR